MAARLLGLFHLLLCPTLLLPLFNVQGFEPRELDALVSSPGGVFRGRVVGGVRAFLGVPYALPPLKDGRFKFSTTGSHFPVLVAFLSSAWSPPPKGPSRLVTHGLVVVAVHFRFQVLGYLSTESPDAPGNVALADQLAALRWIRENIVFFGGDPDRVTALGEGEAATALALLLFSPAVQGLVSQAVIHGGTALTRLSLDPSPFDSAFQLAKVLDCSPLFPFTSPQRLLNKCFRSKSGEELVLGWHGSTHPLSKSMAPTLDVREPPLIEMDPPIWPNIPLLIGVTPSDGLLRVFDYLSKIDLPATPEEPDHLLRVLFATMFSSPATLDAISAYYLHARKGDTWSDLVPIMVQAVTEFSTYSSAAALSRLSSNWGSTYLYELSFGQQTDGGSPVGGSRAPLRPSRSDLVHLLLGVDSLDPDITLDDRVMSDIVVTLWAAFLKNGVPTMPVVPLPSWEPLPPFPGRDLPYYELSLDPRPRPSLRPHALAFWAAMHALDTGQEGRVEKDEIKSYRAATWILLVFCLLMGSLGFCLLCPRLRDTAPAQRIMVYLCPHLLSAQQTEV